MLRPRTRAYASLLVMGMSLMAGSANAETESDEAGESPGVSRDAIRQRNVNVIEENTGVGRSDHADHGAAEDDVSGVYYDWTKTLGPERPWRHDYNKTLVVKCQRRCKNPQSGGLEFPT
jgi:hypothetical protein